MTTKQFTSFLNCISELRGTYRRDFDKWHQTAQLDDIRSTLLTGFVVNKIISEFKPDPEDEIGTNT